MINAILLSTYGIIMLYIAYRNITYDDDMADFLVAGRDQKKILVVASMLASTVGGGLTIGSVTRAYIMGFPAFWLIAAGAIAYYLQGYFLASKVRETEALTLSDLANKLVGSRVSVLTSIIIVITWIGMAATQFVAAASIISNLTSFPYHLSILLVGSFLVIYTLMGGQRSIMKTHFLQSAILGVSLICTLAYLYIFDPPMPGAVVVNLFSETFRPTNLLYYIVVMGGSFFICPMMFTRILSAESPEVARRSTNISGTGMLIFAFTIVFIGLWAKAMLVDLQGQQPLNLIAQSYVPSFFGVVLIFGLLSAIISTADTTLLTAAGTIQKDIIGRNSVLLVRFWVLVIGVIAYMIGLYYTDIIGLIMKTYNGYSAGLVPPIFIVIISAGKKQLHEGLIFTAIVIGYAIGLIGSFMPDGSQAAYVLPLIGMASSTVIGLAAVYFYKGTHD